MKKLLPILFLAAATLLAGCTQIDTGNIGVGRSFGKVDPDPVGPGIYATLFDSVDEFTGKEVSFQMSDLKPKSLDNLTIADLDIDVYFKTAPACIPKLYTKYTGDYVTHGQIVADSKTPDVLVVGYGRILRAAREATYDAVSTFPATTMHTKRADIAQAIQSRLQREVDDSDKGCFTITSINVRNLLTDPAIERAIRARAETDQEIARAQKEIELARANAQVRIEAARGQAEANRILGESLTGNVMQLRMAEIQRDTIVQSAKAGNTIISGDVQPLITTGR